jgi:transposase-like protein
MARLAKRDHATILQMVDVEQRKVSEVAAEYGCSPANIYTLLSKLRRTALAQDQRANRASAEPVGAAAPPEPEVQETAAPAPAADLFAAAETPPVAKPPAPAPTPVSATVTELARKRGGVGATLAKPGFGLTMRSGEGDENMTPFRSLEDLLSAVKPILRASARNPDPVWFSIQPIDLSSIEFDAA